MDAITELERRIMAALARLDAGMERRMASPAASGPSPALMAELDTLREELDEERMANAQMAERLKVQRERAERVAGELHAEVAHLTRQVDDQALAMQDLVASTIRMREDLRRLRASAAAGVDPALVDRALAAELEAADALRAAEVTELNDLVAALSPIVHAEEVRAHG